MKKIMTTGLAMLACMAAPVHAQGMPLKTGTGTDIGIQLSDYKYEEEVDDRFFMSLAGKKIGLTASFTQTLDDDWYWGGDVRYAAGSTDYTSAGSGSKSANTDAYVDVRLTTGQDMESGSQLLSPYAGLGYRYLNNDLRGMSSTGAQGYRRTSSYLYIPLGVTHRFHLGQDARFATTLEYDYLVQGIQRSYLTDATSAGYNSDLENLQRNGHGLRLNLAYETAGWSTGVFYHYWNIADSEIGTFTKPGIVYAGIEPHNITREFGVQLKLRFD